MKATSLMYITFLEFLRRRVREMWIYNLGYILRRPFIVCRTVPSWIFQHGGRRIIGVSGSAGALQWVRGTLGLEGQCTNEILDI